MTEEPGDQGKAAPTPGSGLTSPSTNSRNGGMLGAVPPRSTPTADSRAPPLPANLFFCDRSRYLVVEPLDPAARAMSILVATNSSLSLL